MIYLPIIFLAVAGAVSFKRPGVLFGCALLAYQYETAFGLPILSIALTGGFFALTIFLVIVNGKMFKVTATDIAIPMFAAVYALMALHGPNPDAAIFFAIKFFAFCVGFYFAARYFASSPRYQDRFIFDFGLSAAVQTLLFGYLAFSQQDAATGRMVLGEGSGVGFSQMTDIGIAFCLFFLLAPDRSQSKKAKCAIFLFLIGIAAIVVLNATRGVIVSVGLAGFAYVFILSCARTRGLTKRLISLFFLCGALALFGLQFFDVLDSELYIASLSRLAMNVQGGGLRLDESASVRLLLLREGMEFFTASPWFGKGVGGFGYHSVHGISYPHNIFVELLAETGLFVTLFFTALLARFAWISLRLMQSSGNATAVAIAVGLFLVSVIHHQMSFSIWMAKPLFAAMGTMSGLYFTSAAVEHRWQALLGIKWRVVRVFAATN